MLTTIKNFFKSLFCLDLKNSGNKPCPILESEINEMCLYFFDDLLKCNSKFDLICRNFFNYFDEGISVSYEYAYNNISNYFNMDLFLTPFLNAFRKIMNKSFTRTFLDEVESTALNDYLHSIYLVTENGEPKIRLDKLFNDRKETNKLDNYIDSIFFYWLLNNTIRYIETSNCKKMRFLRNDAELFYTRNIQVISQKAAIVNEMYSKIMNQTSVTNIQLADELKDYIVNKLSSYKYTQDDSSLLKLLKESSTVDFMNALSGKDNKLELFTIVNNFKTHISEAKNFLESQIKNCYNYSVGSRIKEVVKENSSTNLYLNSYNVDIFWRDYE